MQNIMRFLKRLKDDQNQLVLKREIESIRNQGERVTHLYPNDNYYSHLSIYDFAIQYTRGCNVLDVGSGSGYGCAYLATHGAKKIVGVEQDRNAVRFSNKNFRKHLNLQFKQMDAGKLSGFNESEFEVVFSSNVLEHVLNVRGSLSQIVNILSSNGTLILAVPAIYDIKTMAANLNNPYHINIWTKHQWFHILSRIFKRVEYVEQKFSNPTIEFKHFNKPEETTITEKDFSFNKVSVFDDTNSVLTAIFVASEPHKQTSPTDSYFQFIDNSFCVNLPTRKINCTDENVFLSDIVFSTQTNIGRLKKGLKYYQTFNCDRNYLSGIALCIATYRKQIDSELSLSLLDRSGAVIRVVKQNTREVSDNTFFPFLFDAIPDSKDKIFTFSIETISNSSEVITLWTNNGICKNPVKNKLRPNHGLLFKRCYQQ